MCIFCLQLSELAVIISYRARKVVSMTDLSMSLGPVILAVSNSEYYWSRIFSIPPLHHTKNNLNSLLLIMGLIKV